MKVRFKREYEGDVVILSPPRNMFGGDETEEIEGEILRQLAARTRKFIIDFRRTANMNTKAITMFYKIRENLEDVGATWAFCNVDEKIEQPLVVMKIVRLFNVCETRAEALSTVSRKAG